MERKSVITNINQEQLNSDIGRSTRSRLSGNVLDNGKSFSGNAKPVISIPPSNTSEHDDLRNTDNLLPKRLQRRSVVTVFVTARHL